MKFNYKARTKEGKIETGVIEAYSKEAAAVILQKYSIFVTSLEEEKTKGRFFESIEFSKKVSKRDLAIFFRQLSVMLESRVPVVESLSILAAQNRKNDFKKTIFKISTLVESGVPLSEALATYPKTFNNFYVSLVKSGEASGKISSSLYYISDQLEREDDIIAQVKQAMVYPSFVVGVLFVVITIVILVVVPIVENLIKEYNSKPAFFIIIILNFYKFLRNYWLVLIIGFVLLVAGAIYYFTTKEGRRNYDRISLRIPLVRGFLRKVFLARFCGNVSTLLTAGISINKALKVTEDTVDNIVYKGIIIEIGRGVSEGEKMSSVMLKYPDYFPSFVIQMIRVGEETGKLDKTLVEVVNFYQKETKRTIALFSKVLEPVMIIFLGLIVLVLAVSVLSILYGAIGTVA